MNKRRRTYCGNAIVVMLAVASLVCTTAVAIGQQTSLQSVSDADTTSDTVEHWDVLPLTGNSLHASPPLVGEKDSLPGFTRELIQVQWRASDPIDIYVIRPKDAAKPPVVLFLYGYPTDTDKFHNDAWCQNVVNHGFAAVGFVSALTGHRYHDRPMKQWFVSELQESLATSVHDVQMVVNYLATRNDLNMDRIGMFGQGSGGTIAILSAAVDPRIKIVDVIDPWGDWPDWLAKSPQIPEDERTAYLKPDFLAKVIPFDPVRWLLQLKDRPVRIQENLFNLAIPEAVRKQIETAAPRSARVVEYHDTKEYSEKVSANGKMLDWLQTELHVASDSITAQEFLRKAVAAEERNAMHQ
jgi:dienelactone hydrolase